ncbi:MAG: carbohydrate ABC transporter permease [Geminicoccaceae bacterium]
MTEDRTDANAGANDDGERTGMIQWESLPRRIVTLYTPLICFIVVLLFPFYWMTITTLKSNEELYNYKDYNPFWVSSPTLANINKLLFETDYPSWLMTTMTVAIVSTFLSIFASVLAAYAIQRLRFKGLELGRARHLSGLPRAASILFIPLATMVFQLGIYDSQWALILTYPTFLIPFCTWLLIGYFKSIPYELEECALIDGATRLQILSRITLPLAVPGLISAGIFAFTLSGTSSSTPSPSSVEREENRPRRRPHPTRRRRRLPLGLPHGRRIAGLRPRRPLLLVLRRVLRVEPDGCGEEVILGVVRKTIRHNGANVRGK